MDVQLPDGTTIKGVPDGTTKAQLAQKLQANGRAVPKEWLSGNTTTGSNPKSDNPDTAKAERGQPKYDLVGNALGAVAEPMLQAAGGVAGSALGGLRGLASPLTGEDPTKAVKSTQEAFAYQPQTAGGKAVSGVLGAVGEVVQAAIDKGAEKIRGGDSGGVRDFLATTAEVAAEGALAVGGASKVLKSAGNRLGAAQTEAQIAVNKAAATEAAKNAGDYIKQNPEVGREAVKTAAKVLGDAKHPDLAETVPAAGEALKWARKNGIDWRQIPAEMQSGIVALVKKSGDTSGLDARAVQREANLRQLPVPIENATRGQLSRDPVQLRTENLLVSQRGGEPLREAFVDQNQKLIENLDLLLGKTRSRTLESSGLERTSNQSELGRSVQDSALKRRAEQSKQRVRAAYKVAEQVEGNKVVSVEPLTRHILEQGDPTTLNYITGKLKNMKAIRTDADGNIIPGTIKLKDLYEVRKEATIRAKSSDGTVAHTAKEAKRVIDQIFERDGGSAYTAAASERARHGLQWEDPRAVSQLIENKPNSRTDRRVALEDTLQKTVISGSVEDLKLVKQRLLQNEEIGNRKLTDEERGARIAGRQAWRDLRGGTIAFIKDEMAKSIAQDERGIASVSPSALKKSLDRIGDEKLDLILGKATREKLRNIEQAAIDLKTVPSVRKFGSDTGNNLLTMVTEILGHTPVVGGFVKVAKGGAKKLSELKEAGSVDEKVQQALSSPIVKPPNSSPLGGNP